MSNSKIEIKKVESIGYENLFEFDTWKVSILSYLDELELDKISYVEAHQETDEIFYLVEGDCTLILYEVSQFPSNFELIHLSKDQIYNVKKGTFHHHVLSCDAKVLIVENRNTNSLNSIRYELSIEEKEILKKNWKEFYENLLYNKLSK